MLDVRGNVTVAVLDIDMTKQMNRPRVARSKACFFISLLLVLLLGDFAICAADSTRQCAVPVGTKSFVFSSEGHTLRGFIEATAGGRNQPAILILHGSGSTDVMHDDRSDGGYYRAQREAFRSAGLATVVWDKAGDGCSEGQYPHGTPIMARATEVLAAIEALKQRPEIDPKRIGLWGISQGGWVAPMAAVRSKDVAFLILVSSPGRDAVSQLEYQAVNALRASGVDETELRSAAATLRRAFAIMRAGGSSQEFAAAVEPLQKYPVLRELGITVGTPEGYRAWQSTTDFVYRPDTALRELKQPTLAIYGDHDVLVDWRESVAIYRESFKRANNHDLTIKIFKGADHNIYGIGRTKSVDGYADIMTGWLRARGFAQSSVEGR